MLIKHVYLYCEVMTNHILLFLSFSNYRFVFVAVLKSLLDLKTKLCCAFTSSHWLLSSKMYQMLLFSTLWRQPYKSSDTTDTHLRSISDLSVWQKALRSKTSASSHKLYKLVYIFRNNYWCCDKLKTCVMYGIIIVK